MLSRFVVAQNAHDLPAVSSLLLDSPSFLWVTRGKPVWGHQAALDTFQARYQGTWKLAPVADQVQVSKLSNSGDVWHIYAPIDFTIGASGQPATTTRFLMNMVVVDTAKGLRVASILPIQAAS